MFAPLAKREPAQRPANETRRSSHPAFDHARAPQPGLSPLASLHFSALQAKLKVGQVDDPLEREADSVADHVMRAPAPAVSTAASRGDAGGDAPRVVHETLRSPGQPLDPATRAFMEPRIGHDFADVRVHTEASAAQSARRINARAYTVGRDVVFGDGQFSPASGEGRRLIAHELAHVVQQSSSRGQAPASGSAGSASGRIVQRTPDLKAAPSPPAWLGELGATAVHVQGDIWNVTIPSLGGDVWVGPYDQLAAHIRQQGFGGTMEAAHIVGGEHLTDIGAPFTYDQAPCVAVDRTLHATWTKGTANLQSQQGPMGGRARGSVGRPTVARADVIHLYHELYRGHPALQAMARNIVQSSAIDAHTGFKMPRAGEPMDAHDGKMPKRSPAIDAHQGTRMPAPSSPMGAHQGTQMPAPSSSIDAHQGTRMPAPSSSMDVHQSSMMPKPSAPMDIFSPTVPQNSSRARPEINLSDYPPDGEGAVTGRFKDGAAIGTVTAVVTSITTAVSIGTDTDISLLGLVEWHFDGAIEDASEELDSVFPDADALTGKVDMDRLVAAYDASISKLNAPQNNLIAAEIWTALLARPKDRDAQMQTVRDNFAKAGGPDGNWQNYLAATDALTSAIFDLQQQLGDAPWTTLPAMASDISQRAEVVSRAGDVTEREFWRLMFSPLGLHPWTYYPLWDLKHVASVLQNLGGRLGGLASKIRSRAETYQRLWVQMETRLNQMSDNTEKLAHRYHLKIPRD